MSSIAPFHACLCVKSETAAVFVDTQQGLLNHMQVGVRVEGEDVTDPDVLKAVEAAVRSSTSVKRITIEGSHLRWTNMATAILKGAAQNKPLREVALHAPWTWTPQNPLPSQNSPPPQEVIDDVRKANPKLRLVVKARGESASYDIT